MKISNLSLSLLTGLTTIMCVFGMRAADLTWDANTSTDGAQDGSGTWDAVTPTWWNGIADVDWDNNTPANAIFGTGTAISNPTVTVASGTTIIVSNITFNSSGVGNYNIASGNSSSRLDLWGTPTITVADGMSVTNLVVISGTSFIKMGGGTLVLKPSKPYENIGPTVVGEGTLIIGQSSGRQIIPGDLTITNGATLKLAQAEQIADSATVTVDTGIFDTSGKAETIGGLILDHDGQILSASSSVSITNNGTMFDFRDGIVFPNLAGTAGLIKTTSGTVTLTNGSGADTFTGSVLINDGTLVLGHSSSSANYALPATTITITNTGVLTDAKDNQINPSATAVVAGGTFELAAHNDTVDTLILDDSGSILNGGNNSKTLTVVTSMDFRDGYCFSKLTSAAQLIKSTPGTVTLAGDNDYSGGTLISEGILQVGDGSDNNRGSLGTGTVEDDAALVLNHGGSFTLDNAIVGSGSLTNLNGTNSLTGDNSYSGGTTVIGGMLLVNNFTGSGSGGGAVNVDGGNLGGTGSINGPVSISSQGVLAPSNLGSSALTINDTLTLGGNTIIQINNGVGQDQVSANIVNYGGTLTINNIGSDLSLGDTFQIFNAGSHGGNFASIAGSPETDMAYSFDPTTGVLSVVPGASQPTLNVSRSGNTLTFSWADSSFKLQSQTNSLTTGFGTNWSDYPDGSTSPVDVTIDPANPSVFFRLSQ